MKEITNIECPFCKRRRSVSKRITFNTYHYVCEFCGYEYVLIVNRYYPKKSNIYYWKRIIDKSERALL